MLLWEGEADGALVGMECDLNTYQEGQNSLTSLEGLLGGSPPFCRGFAEDLRRYQKAGYKLELSKILF